MRGMLKRARKLQNLHGAQALVRKRIIIIIIQTRPMRGVLKRVCNMLNMRSAQALTQKRIVRAPQKRAEKTLHGHA